MNSTPVRYRLPPAWIVVVGSAVLVGAWLRLDQFPAQVLIDDEWHAVHQVLRRTPAAMFLDFGFADYSIPLGILDWYLSKSWGLSEAAMRAPMLLCGLATLAALPLYVAPRLGRNTAAVFAILVAISPLLIVYSRMARPYAITLLLGWIAHCAYQRYHAATRGQVSAGMAYGATAALTVWLHPISGPFMLAPLLWALAQLPRSIPQERPARFFRLLRLALPTGLAIAALVLPPIVTHPHSLAGKSGADMPDLNTLIGVWYAWLGTPSTTVVVICVALAVYAARDVWRALPEARTVVLGITLTLIAVMVARPIWSYNPVTVARYLLPFLPLLLLGVAAGAVKMAGRLAMASSVPRRALAAGAMVLPCVALAVQSPLPPMLRHPNAQTVGLVYHFDFRREKNAFLPYYEAIPLSPFWASLASRPAGSLRVAAAPFYFESYNWDASRWERLSRQTVLPGFLTGLCVDQRWGEVPQSPEFRFRNAVHLADKAALARRQVDFVAWQKPYLHAGKDGSEAIGADTANCEAVLRTKFGPPMYEDSSIVVFPVSRPAPPSPNAPR